MEKKKEGLQTGTTTVGLVCKDGVVLASDRRATMGYMIASKDIDKIYALIDSGEYAPAKEAIAEILSKDEKDIDNLRKLVSKEVDSKSSVEVSVKEITDSFLCARVMAQAIAEQIERRVSFKKVIKKISADVMQAGAKGVKIRVAGRLDGAEIARDEKVHMGSVPLHTLRADIDYAAYEAKTTYGIIGIKVWICRGEYRSVQI